MNKRFEGNLQGFDTKKVVEFEQYTVYGCDDGPCPVIYRATDGNYIVQGYNVNLKNRDDMNIAENENAVFVPKKVIDDLVSKRIKEDY